MGPSTGCPQRVCRLRCSVLEWGMVTLSLGLLGPVQATLDGQPLPRIRSKIAQALLIYLACQPERAHRREHLMTMFWPGLPQRSAQATLRQNLYLLRKAIPEVPARDGHGSMPLVVADRQTVQINPACLYQLDLLAFGKLLKKGPKHWSKGVALYRGDFLADFYLPDSAPFEEWVLARRADLRRQALEALNTLTGLAIEKGDYPSGEHFARQQLTIDNLRESAHQQLIEILALSGRRTAALSQYDTLWKLLQDEVGVEPSSEAMALQAQILAGELGNTVVLAAGIGADTTPAEREALGSTGAPEAISPQIAKPPAPGKPSPIHNLPVPATPFIGRESELARLDELLAGADVRLITIAGPGGAGKSRLALTMAERQLRAGRNGELRFPNGAFFVALDSLTQVEHIVPAVAEALDLQLSEGGQLSPRQQLLNFLRPKRLLIVMDNYEHLQDGADLLVDLLQAAPGVHILVTSRERLRLRQEQLFPIDGLESPAEDDRRAVKTAAAKLFLQSARRVQPDFELRDHQDLTHLVRICNLVSGMPLGLELSASWADTLSLADIADEIQHSLDFLETTLRNLPERHRSMRTVFNTTWQRLGAGERDIFTQLSVFRGGFTCQAAQAISATTLRTLARLVTKSLLQYDRTTERYQVHELLRQFGAEKLAQDVEKESAVRDRHSAHYCAFLQQQWEELKGPRQQSTATEIQTEMDNCRTAWNWAVSRGRLEELARALDGLGEFMLNWRGWYQEAAALFQRANEELIGAHSVDELQLLIRLLSWQATCSDGLGQREQADRQSQRCLACLNQPPISQLDHWPSKSIVLQQLAVHISFSDRTRASQLLEQSLALCREVGDQSGAAIALGFLGLMALMVGNVEETDRLHKESLALHQALGDKNAIAHELTMASQLARYQNRLDESEDLARESMATYQELGNRLGVAQSLLRLGQTHVLQGRYPLALAEYQESLQRFEEGGHMYYLASIWGFMSQAHLHLGQYEKAQALGEQSLYLAKKIDRDYPASLAKIALGQVAMARADLPQAEASFQEAVKIIHSTRKTGVPILLARVLNLSGLALLGLGRTIEASQQLFEALTIMKRSGVCYGNNITFLDAASLLLLKRDQVERAVELYALSRSHPFVANSRWFEDVCGKAVPTAAAALPVEVVERAQRRGRALDWWETLEELDDLGPRKPIEQEV